MEVSKGYKQTEMGPIPNDWDVREFVEVIDGFTSGQTPYRGVASYYKGRIPWITSGELNYNIITDTIEKITPEGVKDANLKMIPAGTFLFAITGLEAEGTRGSCAITGIEATTNQSCMALYPKKGLLTTSYLYHYYVCYGNELALKYCQGTKQQSYTGGIAKKLPIIVPPTVNEQAAIAAVLSDTDAFISSLENFIAKKRNIKQGVVQEVLKPKKGWIWKKLVEIGNIDSDNLDSKTPSDYSFKYISLEDVDFGVLRSFSEIVFKKAPSRARRRIRENDILISTVRPNLKSHLLFKNKDLDWVCSTGFSVLRCNDAVANASFVFNHFFGAHINLQIDNLITGSNYPAISSKDVKQLTIPLPPSIGEQIAIATMLSNMEREINVLESKLSKYRQIKTGMMQNLLTGKIRLV
jgi:type I restriction enzyme, S subunit